MISLRHRFVGLATATLLIAPLLAGTTRAQIPDEFTNLQVLPTDIGKRELVGIMRGYAGALGARCSFCHVGGDDPSSLEGMDFVSDDNEHKKLARGMMKMVMNINEELLPQAGISDPLEVTCVTCHRGLHEPEPLDHVILETLEADGLTAAIERYRELRDEHFGRGAYDFGAATLNSAAETRARDHEDVEGAIALLKLNLEFHPDTAYCHMFLGQLLAASGDTEAAAASLERAIELEPDNARARQFLERVQSTE